MGAVFPLTEVTSWKLDLCRGAARKSIFKDEFNVTSEILIGCKNSKKIPRGFHPKEAEESRTVTEAH